MKKTYSRLLSSSLAAVAMTAVAQAGTTTTTTYVEKEKESLLSGNLSLDVNSHFISYGADVWGDGDSMSEPTFNPSLSLTWELPAGFSATIGTWWDVNSKAGGDSALLGGRVQEVDVWYNIAYTIGDFTTGITYNQWFYGSDTEDSIDLSFAYDTFLSPSLVLHHRFDPGASGGANGTVAVFGLSHSIEAGPVTISFPFNIAYFFGDDFHKGATGSADNGLGYGSIAVTASVPLSFIDEAYGEWSAHAGLTYYVTDQDVIPGNAEGDFLTANVGISIGF